MWLVSDDDEDDGGRVLRLCGTCVLVARVCSANCDLNSFHLPSCPLLSTLVPPFHYPPPSCALFALSSCPVSSLGKPSQKKNILSFGHCLNWRRPPTKIYVDIFLAANFPPNQCNREFLRWLSSGEPSNVIF